MKEVKKLTKEDLENVNGGNPKMWIADGGLIKELDNVFDGKNQLY